jgi:hypothetical protein
VFKIPPKIDLDNVLAILNVDEIKDLEPID